MQLPRPTNDLIDEAVTEFNEGNEAVEGALRLVFTTFPENTDAARVLVKTTLLNRLYSTGIFDVASAAKHIVDKQIDADLAAGRLEVVHTIARMHLGGKMRNQYSFATKYCSWHREDVYPIYDNLVDKCLMAYKRQDPHFSFKQDDLYKYPSFVQIVTDFQHHYGLDCSFKQLDKLLWRTGSLLTKSRSAAAAR